MKKPVQPKKTRKARPAVRSAEWLEDWERRYAKAEKAMNDAQDARYYASLRVSRMELKVFNLRREYKAAQSSNKKLSDL